MDAGQAARAPLLRVGRVQAWTPAAAPTEVQRFSVAPWVSALATGKGARLDHVEKESQRGRARAEQLVDLLEDGGAGAVVRVRPLGSKQALSVSSSRQRVGLVGSSHYGELTRPSIARRGGSLCWDSG